MSADGPAEENRVTTRELSSRQRQVFDLLQHFIAAQGYPPSIRELAQALGISHSAAHGYLETLERKGFVRRDPARSRAIELLPIGGIDRDPKPPPTYAPLIGQIAAGKPILADEQADDLWPLPSQIVGHGELFILRVRGDSMVEAGLLDGDYVIVRPLPRTRAIGGPEFGYDVGDIVVALFEDEATVKHFARGRDGRPLLEPANPDYSAISADEAEILGRVVGVLRSV
jgi:repressor LexA